MSAALELEPGTWIEDSLILRLADLAIKVGSPAVLFHQKFRVSKIERTPISDRVAFLGDIEGVEYVLLPDGRVALHIILKPKAAP